MKTIIKATAVLALSTIMVMNVHAQEKKQLGKEYPPADEEQAITGLVSSIGTLGHAAKTADGTTVRTAHTWAHGLVNANFIVNKNLPKKLRAGIFEAGRSYDALVRFSNSTPSLAKPNDSIADVRGMAVRLLNMPGDKLIKDDNATTFVDFVTQSSEQFNSKTPLEFVTFVTQAGNPDPKISGAYFADPSHGPLLARLVAANKHTDNVLNIPYFSTTPYRFGKSQKVAVKYKIQPTVTNHPNRSVTNPNYLKENLAYDLSQGDVSFDFMIQFQTNADTQPIEDPTVIWGTPFIKIATIIIPKQVFDTPEKNTQAENMAFNPWHTIEAHQPLGGVNRARKIVYEAMQKIRHQQNGVK